MTVQGHLESKFMGGFLAATACVYTRFYTVFEIFNVKNL